MAWNALTLKWQRRASVCTCVCEFRRTFLPGLWPWFRKRSRSASGASRSLNWSTPGAPTDQSSGWSRDTSPRPGHTHTNPAMVNIHLMLVHVCEDLRAPPYVAECRGPVDFVVGTDAGVLCLESKGEGGDVEN